MSDVTDPSISQETYVKIDGEWKEVDALTMTNGDNWYDIGNDADSILISNNYEGFVDWIPIFMVIGNIIAAAVRDPRILRKNYVNAKVLQANDHIVQIEHTNERKYSRPLNRIYEIIKPVRK